MASNKSPKNWVLTTSPSYSPGGALSLGQVLTNPYDASSGLVSSNVLSVPEGTLRDETSWKDVNEQFTNAIGAKFHALFNDASGLVAGAHANANHHRHDRSNYRISKIRSIMFQPSVSYAKQLLEIDNVPTKKPWFGQTRLYMVTGLRIAEGVSLDATASRASHVGAGAAGDFSLVGAPIRTGLSGHRGTMTENHKSVADISSFVFAYRLHEIIWTGILKKPSLESFSRGSTHSIEPDWADWVDPGLAEMTGFQIDKVADQPFDGEGYDNKERMTE